MDPVRWIQTSLFSALVLHLAASAAGQYLSAFTVPLGGEVTLPCGRVDQDQRTCVRTVWIFSTLTNTVLMLFESGEIHREAQTEAGRLKVTESCSLKIKQVADEDVGRYTCRQFTSDQTAHTDYDVDVSVVSVTQQKSADEVRVFCSVRDYVTCRHSVMWTREAERDTPTDTETSPAECAVAVMSLRSKHKSKRQEAFQCKVTDSYTEKVELFPISLQSSDFSGETTTKKMKTTFNPPSTTTEMKISTINTPGATPTNQQGFLFRSIAVPLGLAALIVSVVTVNVWTKIRGTKTKTDKNTRDVGENVVMYENTEESSASADQQLPHQLRTCC